MWVVGGAWHLGWAHTHVHARPLAEWERDAAWESVCGRRGEEAGCYELRDSTYETWPSSHYKVYLSGQSIEHILFNSLLE